MFRKKEGVLISSPELTLHRVDPADGAEFLILGSDGLWEGLTKKKVKIQPEVL